MLTRFRKRAIFELFFDETLNRGRGYWWRPRGFSMVPLVQDGDRVLVVPVDPRELRIGDIVKFRAQDGFGMHRLIWRSRKTDGTLEFGFQGDNAPVLDPPIPSSHIVGLAVAVERRGKVQRLDTVWARLSGRLKILKRFVRERIWSVS